MKKLMFLAIVSLCSGLAALAQPATNFGYMNSRYVDSSLDKPIVHDGMYVGLSWNFELGNGFGVEPGLEWSYLVCSDTKGIEIGEIFSASATYMSTENYLDIPVKFNYGYELGAVRLFAYAGPIVSFGLSSVSKVKTVGGGNVLGDVTGPGSKINRYKNGDYSRFDVLMGAGAGIDFGLIRLVAGYSWGLLYRIPDTESLHRNQIKVGLAYMF